MSGGTLALLLCALVFSTDHPMSPWNIAALVSRQRELKLKVLMSTGLSDMLQKAAGGFMSATEEQQVRKQHGDDEQMGKLIEILKGKQDKDFIIFLEMLQSANYGGWADELERKAKEFKKVNSKCVQSICIVCWENVGVHQNLPLAHFRTTSTPTWDILSGNWYEYSLYFSGLQHVNHWR